MNSLQHSARRMLWKRHIPGYELWCRLRFRREHPALERDVFGIHFRHPVGLAPVLERQVDLLDECDGIGFSFTGVIPGETPVQTVAERLQARTTPIVVSVELRAEGDEEEKAQRSLIRQYSLLYDFTDYFVIDINRESGLSSLDDLSDWTPLLDEVLNLRLCYEKYRPILLRISPGHSEEQMARILDYCLISGLDGVVAPGISKVRFCAEYTKNRLPIIGSGAVTTTEEAIALLQAGASLIEVAHGLRNKGLSSAKRLLQAIDNPPKQS
ncbi:MAG: hypothetical protein IKM75_07310 [Bacteroidales bacterium]|nr:hypothetical protein [Bacteroidales bacterium]